MSGRPAWLLRVALLAVAAAAAALLLAELYVSGAPLGPIDRTFVYPPSIAISVAVAGLAALSRSPRRAPVVAGALALALFLANDRAIVSGDTHPAALVPFSILRHGTLSLDPVPTPTPRPYWVVEHGGRLWSHYPVVAPILALPVYIPVALGPGRPGQCGAAEKLSASIMAAISVGFVLAALLALGAPPWLAAAATALYAAGSPVLSTASQALWQHGPSVLALSAAIWAAIRTRAEPRFAALAGLFAGLAVAARLTDVVVVAALGAMLISLGRRQALRFLALAPVPVALTGVYQWFAFGAPWATGYGDQATGFGYPFGPGLAGVLLSPTRGLFTYVPWAPLALLGLALGARRDRLILALFGGSVATIALFAKWNWWWGGWCYGPRLLSDLSPVLAVGLAPLAAFPARRLAPALALTGALAVGLSALGAFGSRTPTARAVYDADGSALAMEWWRYPLAARTRAAAALPARAGR
jgi:hypothetical protein